MPRGSKEKYTGKQKRMAEHIEDSYESRGISAGEAKRRAWSTVNKETGGGEKSGSGRNRSESSKQTARKAVGRSAAYTKKHGGRKNGRRNTSR